MNNRNIKSIVALVIIISLIMAYIASNSFAYEYQTTNYTLFYKEDIQELKEDIKTYISDIDDYLIPNSSYKYSNILAENYDFLTNFAIAYIINHKETYKDNIVSMTSFTYNDIYNDTNETNEYIDIDEIYNITDKYFGISDYYVINDNVNFVDNYISLSENNKNLFASKIENIDIIKENNMIIANIIYDSSDKYKYTFKIINNVLKIYNVEVSEWKR